ncbi:threonine dehydrogenase-like Zn-dependent dehydrogenase [Pseudorhizobium tarimense]|uniref:Threonine dehydrogenase-like Zn-dependent dehydrogenase n=1 Tax=Pseudorhizobium tarimense TaxID=1079109 RepID=A0ABV2HBX7_9HYPH|nr:alcohol dehydrogenase catalytic domain-containing protein [Pseudorhizobium tarimense]MCJ8520931.1 alcohol dehydrogenase catalytic domain-containing protein [Pseudorhizobium tarimense]
MRAVVYRGPKELTVEELPTPRGAGALVEVEACGICGTDLTIFAGKHPRAQPELVLGHEFVGRLAEPVPERGLAVGARVVCYPLISCGECDPCKNGMEHVCDTLRLIGIDSPGGMAGRVRIRPDALYSVSQETPSVVAAQAEPLAVCVHAANVADITGHESVAIIGAGPIGVTLAIALRQRGVQNILLSDTSLKRVEVARELGFQAVEAGSDLSAPADAAERVGFDVVFECAGAGPAVGQAIAHTRTGGKIVMVSIHKSPQPVDLQALSFRELRILGTRVYTRDEFQQAIDLLPSLEADLTSLVSRVIDMEEAPATFDQLCAGAADLKVIVRNSCGSDASAEFG